MKPKILKILSKILPWREIPSLFFIWGLIGFFGHKYPVHGPAYFILIMSGIALGIHTMDRYTEIDNSNEDVESNYDDNRAELEMTLHFVQAKDGDIKNAIMENWHMIQSCAQCIGTAEQDAEFCALKSHYDSFVREYDQFHYDIRIDTLNSLYRDIRLSDMSDTRKRDQIILLEQQASRYRHSIIRIAKECDDLTIKAITMCVRKGCLPDDTV